jgi:hypothetical protein
MFNMFSSSHEPCLRIVDAEGEMTRRGRPDADNSMRALFDDAWAIKMLTGQYDPLRQADVAHMVKTNIASVYRMLTNKDGRTMQELVHTAVRARVCSIALAQPCSPLVEQAESAAWGLLMAGGGDSDLVDALLMRERAPLWLATEVRAWSLGREGRVTVIPFKPITIQTTRLVSNRDGITVYAKRSGVVINVAKEFSGIVFNHKRLARASLDRDIPWLSSVVWPIKSIQICPDTKMVRMKCSSPAPSYICTLDFESSVAHAMAFAFGLCKSVSAIHVCKIAHGCLRGGFFFAQVHQNPPNVVEDISIALAPIFDRIRFRPDIELDAPERIMSDPFMRDIMDVICICTRLLYGSDLRSVATREAMRASMEDCRTSGATRMEELPVRAWVRINYYVDRLCDSVFSKPHDACLIDLVSLCVECRKHVPFKSSKDILRIDLSSSVDKVTPGFFSSRPSNMQPRGADHPWVAAAAASISVSVRKLTSYQRKLDHRSIVKAIEKMEIINKKPSNLIKALEVEEGVTPLHIPLQMIPTPLMKPVYPVDSRVEKGAAGENKSM